MFSHWDDYKQRLRAYIAKHLDDSSSVDDILHEVYLKAHGKVQSLESEQSIGAWLYRITYNAVVDHYRHLKPHEELSDSLVNTEIDIAEQAHQDLARCLTPMMNELDDKYRIPLQLADLDGFSQKQVADELNISLSGAKSRIQRARKQLRNRLTACCNIEIGRGSVLGYEQKNTDCDDC